MSSPDQWLENAIVFGVYPPSGGGGGGVTPQQVQQSAFNFVAATGVDDAFVVSLTPSVVALTDGLLVTMSSGTLQNTVANPTLKVDALPPKPIVLWAGSLAPGDIEAGASYIFIYNQANDEFKLINPSITTADTFSVQANFYNVAIDAGAPNAYVATIVPSPTGSIGNAFPLYLVIGAGNTNTGDSTVTLNGISHPIYRADGSQIPAGSLVAGQMAFLLYSSSKSGFILMNPVTAASIGGTLNHLLRSDGTQFVQSTAALLDASDNLSGLTSVAAGNLSLAANTLSSTNSNGNLSIIPNGTGATLIGSTTAVSNSGAGAYLQVARGGGQGLASIQTYANTTGGANISLVKSRSTTIGTFVPVVNGDGLGGLNFFADDGTQLVQCSAILSTITSAVSTGITPTNLLLKTMNTSGALTTALTLDSSQNATFEGTLAVGNFLLSGNTFSSTNTNGNMSLIPNGSGAVLVGATTQMTSNAGSASLQLAQNNSQGLFSVGAYTAAATGAGISVLKSRSTTVGTFSAVQNGDVICNFNMYGDDGTSYGSAKAQILCKVSGAVSTGIVPTSWTFSTTNTSGALLSAMTISNAQVVALTNPLLPASGGTGISSLGTGVATALGIAAVGNTAYGVALSGDSTAVVGLTFGSGSVGITYSTNLMSYSRNGNVITFALRIVLTNKGSSTGVVAITGFPLGLRNSAQVDAVFDVASQNLTYSGQVKCVMLPGTTTVNLYSNATGAALTQLTDTAFTNTTDLIISGSYCV